MYSRACVSHKSSFSSEALGQATADNRQYAIISYYTLCLIGRFMHVMWWRPNNNMAQIVVFTTMTDSIIAFGCETGFHCAMWFGIICMYFMPGNCDKHGLLWGGPYQNYHAQNMFDNVSFQRLVLTRIAVAWLKWTEHSLWSNQAIMAAVVMCEINLFLSLSSSGGESGGPG